MENQSQQKVKPILGGGIGSLIIVLLAILVFPKIISGDLFGNKSTKAAEKYVNQQVYTTSGITCDRFKSETVYKDGDVRLIAVEFYFEDSSSAVGSYCVYCNGGYVSSSTKMMGAGYDYKSHLAELKALFGI